MRPAGLSISLSETSTEDVVQFLLCRNCRTSRRVIVKFFLKKELISAKIATSLVNWRHSGFSVDASVHIPAGSSKTREALSQYIARPPLSLKKISIEENVQLPQRGNCLADWLSPICTERPR